MTTRPGDTAPIASCAVLVGLFALSVVGANWAVTHLGTPDASGIHTIPVGFGWRSPSGVVFVGLTLTIRDALHRACGYRAALVAILLGSALTLAIAPGLALASATAFLLAELADLLVFTPLRRRSIVGAVLASNTVGALVDSAVFLFLAFGATAVADFAFPQVVGKIEWSLLALPLLYLRGGREARPGHAPA